MPEVVSGFEARLDVSRDPSALADRAAAWMLQQAQAAQERFTLCLSGGSTPKALYARLAQAPYRDAFPWARTHLFWGDERFVPATDPLSNYAMVKAALLDHVPIPPQNVHPVPTEHTDPRSAAAAYEAKLKTFYGADRLDAARPLFDVNLLGLGPDGHTASLFPDTAVLGERAAWVSAVIGAKAEARITLTYPALESSRHAAFLVVGEEKTDILARLRDGDTALPAAHLRAAGETLIFADEAAAGRPPSP